MNKVSVIGVYGTGPDFTTGQAVKCHVLIDWLNDYYGFDKVKVVNTYKWKKAPLRLLKNVFLAFKQSTNIILLPAQNGIRVFAPLIYFLNKFFKRKIHYIVIGGWLAEMLESDSYLKKCVKKFDGVHVEMLSMKERLEEIGLTNVFYMPNSRFLEETCRNPKPASGSVKVCTYSRVIKTKGIDDAIGICRKANEIIGGAVFSLDVYGRVDSDYLNEFQLLIKNNRDIVAYQGCKKPNETLPTLMNYFALLFPTYYEGEGFAGTILDAFSAELPIIANDWKYNSEIIQDSVNGFIYPFRNIEFAANVLVRIYQDKGLYEFIQKNCRESAIQYSTDYVMRKFALLLD